MRNTRMPIILLVIFAILIAIVFLQSGGTITLTATPTPSAVPAPAGSLLRVFPDMAVLDILAIRLHDPDDDKSFAISRDSESGVWIAPNLSGELDGSAATGIARTMVLMPYGDSFSIAEDSDLRIYGFNPGGRLFIDIIMRDGSTHSVAVGALEPSGKAYFTLVDDRLEVYRVERGAIDYLINFLNDPPVNETD